MDQYAVFSSFFFKAYSAFWALAKPFARNNERLKNGWTERTIPKDWAKPVDMWLHAASAGEAKLILSMLDEMPELPRLKILITTMTKQGKEVLGQELPRIHASKPWLKLTVRYAPLDDPSIARRAVEQAKPKVLILFETELWPGLLGACAECGVPVHMLNARISKASFELFRIIQSTLRTLPIFSIFAITRDDAQRFKILFGRDTIVPCHIETMRNIKFDRAASDLRQPVSRRLNSIFRLASPVYVLASVRRKEEKQLTVLISKIFQQQPAAVLVLAPRHMERVEPWHSRLYDMGLRPSLASKLDKGQPVQPGQVLIWDVFGSLPDLYAAADAVFVGGSLSGGGQNFLEAVATGIVPCVGDDLEHFQWAIDEENPPSLIDAGLLRVCSGQNALLDCLLASAAENRDRFAVRDVFQDWLTGRTGSSRQAAELSLDFLEQSIAAQD